MSTFIFYVYVIMDSNRRFVGYNRWLHSQITPSVLTNSEIKKRGLNAERRGDNFMRGLDRRKHEEAMKRSLMELAMRSHPSDQIMRNHKLIKRNSGKNGKRSFYRVEHNGRYIGNIMVVDNGSGNQFYKLNRLNREWQIV